MCKRICGQPAADELDRIKRQQQDEQLRNLRVQHAAREGCAKVMASLNHEHRARQTATQPATGTLSVFRDRKSGKLMASVDGVPISNAVSITFSNTRNESSATIICENVELEP